MEYGIGGDKTEANIGDADYWVIKLEGNCLLATEITGVNNRQVIDFKWNTEKESKEDRKTGIQPKVRRKR